MFSVNSAPSMRSEERFSRNAETELVCRLLLEKKIGDLGLPTTLVVSLQGMRVVRCLLSFPTRRSSDLRRSGLICLARSSRTGLDMSHILFMVEILLLTF